MTDLDHLSAWQYHLPSELIASRPAAQRDASRLMVVERNSGNIQHLMIRDLPDLLRTGDLLVFNNTKVLPARLFGFRTSTGGLWEGLFVEQQTAGHWLMLAETRGKPQPGETITIRRAYERTGNNERQLTATLLQKQHDGSWLVEVDDDRPAVEILEEFGSLPLPPYMGRKLADEQDRLRYQTAFASQPGAVAAPTAGLHFNSELLERCRNRGVYSTELTLHAGIGTFRPVSAERLSEHPMHHEWCQLPSSACDEINRTRSAGGRVVAVGTTSVRTLESAAASSLSGLDSSLREWHGHTNLFIRPGYHFQLVDCLLTNFHLPGSTLIVLVAALAGYDLVMEAYRQAIERQYRFYSYGDAMLIL